MKIILSDIPPEGLSLKGSEDVEFLLPGEACDIEFVGPLEYDLNLILVSGELIAMGCLKAKANLTCSRCAERFMREVEEENFNFSINIDDSVGEGTDSVERAGRGTRKKREDLESVDLTNYMREAIILTLPNYPVCREDCKGLCGKCGADLNRGQCDCSPVPGEGWEVLDNLRFTKEKG